MSIYIEAGRLISDEGLLTDGAIRVENGTITAVGSTEDVSSADTDREYILPDHTVLPGLIDTHVHLGTVADEDIVRDTLFSASPSERAIQAIKNARTTVEAGITTVRDLSTYKDTAITVGNEIQEGTFKGPRVFACGNGLLPTGGHGVKTPWYLPESVNDTGRWYVADGIKEVREGVRKQVQMGADLIKVWSSSGTLDPEGAGSLKYSHEELNALVEEASRHDLPVAADAMNPEAIKACVDAGVHTIEHGLLMNEDSVDKMLSEDVYLTLTREINALFTENESVEEFVRESTQRALDQQDEVLPYAIENDLKILMGTDAGAIGLHHGENAKEIVRMAELGLEPMEAIEASTSLPAEMLGIDDSVGTLREDYVADVIAMEGDPTTDINLFEDSENVSLVLARGDVVKDST